MFSKVHELALVHDSDSLTVQLVLHTHLINKPAAVEGACKWHLDHPVAVGNAKF